MRLTALLMTLAIANSLETSAADEPIVVAEGQSAARPQQPQIAYDEKGAIHLVYGAEGKAYYLSLQSLQSKSKTPSKLPPSGVMSLGMRRGPRIAATKNGVCVTLIAGEQGKGKDGDILAFVKKKEEPTWSQATEVNDVPGSGREGLHAMASGDDGKLACVWLDLRNQKSEIMISLSSDGGQTWSKDQLVYQSPDGGVCPCCHPSVAFGKAGAIHVMWRNALGGARDMFTATSTDGGKTFSAAKKLGQGTWKLDICPMDGGMLCADASGELSTIWRREKQLFLCSLHQPEQGLGAGEQPWIAATAKGAAAVWISKRGGTLYLLQPGESKPIALAENAADPVIAASRDGKSCAVAWERRAGEKTAVMLQVFQVK